MNYQTKHFRKIWFEDIDRDNHNYSLVFQTTNMNEDEWGFIEISKDVLEDYEIMLLDDENQWVEKEAESDGETVYISKFFVEGAPNYEKDNYAELFNAQLEHEATELLGKHFINCILTGDVITYNRAGMLPNRLLQVPTSILEKYKVDVLDMEEFDYWHILYLTLNNKHE
jgi:hypothetical protein